MAPRCRPCPPASQPGRKGLPRLSSRVQTRNTSASVACASELKPISSAFAAIPSSRMLIWGSFSAPVQRLPVPLALWTGRHHACQTPTVILQWPTMLLRVALARTEFGAPVVRPLQNPFCLRGISPEWNSWCQLAPSLLRSAVAKPLPVVLDNPTNRAMETEGGSSSSGLVNERAIANAPEKSPAAANCPPIFAAALMRCGSGI